MAFNMGINYDNEVDVLFLKLRDTEYSHSQQPDGPVAARAILFDKKMATCWASNSCMCLMALPSTASQNKTCPRYNAS